MTELLEHINSPNDVKKLTTNELIQLAAEIRTFLIESVSKTGGHLASNLGVVELTLAIDKVFQLPQDKVIWDVGHQTYVHKLLTGRRARFETLRQYGGMSGFPKCDESPYDCFNTGHSSTSISAALGMAKARDIKGEDNFIAAVIGDGALTGGMAFEALNDAGILKKNFIVILNDNEMSISRNVGGISGYLTKLRSSLAYFHFKAATERAFRKIPVIGTPTVYLLKKIKDNIRHLFTAHTIFEDLGFTYLGPIDGHDIKLLSFVLESAKRVNGPVLVHILTKKGKGYEFAEKYPTKFHGISRFCVDTGDLVQQKKGKDYSAVFGKSLLELAEQLPNVCSVTAAMPVGTGLTPFAVKYPDRFFDVGIAEQHAVTFAAGLAKGGFLPVVAVYSSFLQRAYDQILHDVCLQNLHIIFCVDRAGVVGEDGETHQGLFDISFLAAMPNMSLLAPSNFTELAEMLHYAVAEHDGPIALRYPRGGMQYSGETIAPFAFGEPIAVAEGSDVCILCAGNTLCAAMDARKLLSKENISAAVINLRTLFPLNRVFLQKVMLQYPLIVTMEDGIRRGGIGEAIAAYSAEINANIKIMIKAHDNPILPHGKPEILYRLSRLDAESVAQDIISALKGTNHEKG